MRPDLKGQRQRRGRRGRTTFEQSMEFCRFERQWRHDRLVAPGSTFVVGYAKRGVSEKEPEWRLGNQRSVERPAMHSSRRARRNRCHLNSWPNCVNLNIPAELATFRRCSSSNEAMCSRNRAASVALKSLTKVLARISKPHRGPIAFLCTTDLNFDLKIT